MVLLNRLSKCIIFKVDFFLFGTHVAAALDDDDNDGDEYTLSLHLGHDWRFCVCSLVLMTSNGLVIAAAIAPAIEPAVMEVVRLYPPEGSRIFLLDSFTATITAP
jgi:hypothetical protein